MGNEKVILIDAMGLLRTCYQLADVAIVGGSFVQHIGGHNIMEPSAFAKPVIFGPYMHSQLELAALMLQGRAGAQVEHDHLEGILKEWFNNESLRKEVGERGLELVNRLKGSINRAFDGVKSLFSE
jgi:3-deoxy-D-manno-octulosonic-acid transferase